MADIPALLAKCPEKNQGGALDGKAMLMAPVSASIFRKVGEIPVSQGSKGMGKGGGRERDKV